MKSCQLFMFSILVGISTLPYASREAGAAPHPNFLLNQSEIAAIKAKVAASQEPWASAHAEMLKRANAALAQKPLSVTYAGNPGHDYFTESPYCGWNLATSPCGKSCCDGQFNPNADRNDYKAAIDLGKAVLYLGLGYAFTGKAVYADKAIALINTWCVDPATYMTPKVYTNWQSLIELYITIPGVFYGADLIWNYSGWAPGKKASFLAWARKLADNALKFNNDPQKAQNFGDWRLVLLSSAAVILEDKNLVGYVGSFARKMFPNQIDIKGVTVKEIGRTKGLSYSSYAVNAMVQVCEAMRHQGDDLYHFSASNGTGSVKKAIDWVRPFVVNPSKWPYKQIAAYHGENAALFEMAKLTWNEAAYDTAITRWGRPMHETRTAGPVTLTHARGAYPWKLGTNTGPADTTAPSVVAVDAGPSNSRVVVSFSEPVHAKNAENSANYKINPSVAVKSASLTSDMQVELTTSPLAKETLYTLEVRNVSDRASPPNTLAPTSVSFSYLSGIRVSNTWINRSIQKQSSAFVATFSARPLSAAMDGVMGFSLGSAKKYEDLGQIVRFSPEGTVEARSAGKYVADKAIPYEKGHEYLFRLEVDLASKRYAAFVTPLGSGEIRIGKDLLFRTEQVGLNEINNFAAYCQLEALDLGEVSLVARTADGGSLDDRGLEAGVTVDASGDDGGSPQDARGTSDSGVSEEGRTLGADGCSCHAGSGAPMAGGYWLVLLVLGLFLPRRQH